MNPLTCFVHSFASQLADRSVAIALRDDLGCFACDPSCLSFESITISQSAARGLATAVGASLFLQLFRDPECFEFFLR